MSLNEFPPNFMSKFGFYSKLWYPEGMLFVVCVLHLGLCLFLTLDGGTHANFCRSHDLILHVALWWQVGFAKAEAALKRSAVDMRMYETAEMAPLVRMHMLKKGDVQLLHSKFCELDQNSDSKIQWAEFERGRNTLPNSIQVAQVHVARLVHWLHKPV